MNKIKQIKLDMAIETGKDLVISKACQRVCFPQLTDDRKEA